MARNTDNYRMVVCTYEPVPLRMSKVHEAIVGGVKATMEKGRNYLIPYFIVVAARHSYCVDHDMPQQKGDKDTIRHRKQRPTMIVTEIDDLFPDDENFDPEEYKGAENVDKLLQLAKTVTDPEDPIFDLQLGVDNVDYSALKHSESPEAIAEKQMRDTTKKGADQLTNELVDARLKLQKAESANTTMLSVMEKMEARLNALESAGTQVIPVGDGTTPTKQQKAAATRKANKEKEALEE